IMAPNFSITHGLRSVEGYYPLYVERYGEFTSCIYNKKPGLSSTFCINTNIPMITSPFGFKRIIRIEDFSSDLVDLLGVKYVMSITDMNIVGYKKVFEDGQTKIYENDETLPRAFFVKNLEFAKNKNDAIKLMFDRDFIPLDDAVVEENINGSFSQGNAEIVNYSDNKVIIQTQNDSPGFLVLTDTFYPT